MKVEVPVNKSIESFVSAFEKRNFVKISQINL